MSSRAVVAAGEEALVFHANSRSTEAKSFLDDRAQTDVREHIDEDHGAVLVVIAHDVSVSQSSHE